MSNGGSGGPGTVEGVRDFTKEMNTILGGLVRLMNDARSAGQTFTFNVGDHGDESGGFFVEKLTVTTDAREP